MSDFDAEAERKRLREKYEADEESRKQTQQMSELLLKGATMTNSHCGECGSPIFRYDDQEFCPNCQRTMGGDDAEDAAGSDTEASAGAAATEASEVAADAANVSESAATTGADVESETPSTGAVGASNGVADVGATVTPGRDRTVEGAAADEPAASDRSDAAAVRTTGEDGAAPTRQAARESLLAALTRHARLAADTDEPRRATDHLEAAREAAAALDELDGS